MAATSANTGKRKTRRRLVVAIDGPAGSGKTTVAKGVARALKLRRLDTGAMYRAVTLKALREGIDPGDGRALAELARRTRFGLDDRGLVVDGKHVGPAIRTSQVSGAVSQVAAHPAVRRELVRRQRELIGRGGFVAEGRDIGTVVSPDADVKVFLTASAPERARRRQTELHGSGVRVPRARLRRDLDRRDRLDSTRAASPLAPARDAHRIDSTGRSANDVVKEIVGRVREVTRGAKRGG